MKFPMKLILGILGNATALALFLSPMPTFWSIFKSKSTQEFSGVPYVSTLFTCSLWILYGLPFVKPKSTLLLTINGVGFALELFYVIIFLTYASKRDKVKTMRLTVAMSVGFMILVMILVLVVHSSRGRQLLAGIVSVILSTVMYASPLSVMGLVIRTKSVEYMPFPLSLFNLLNAAIWSAYSLAARDIFIAVPNGLGCLLAVFQLGIYLLYKNSNPRTSNTAI